MLMFRLLFILLGAVLGGFLGHLGASGVYYTLRMASIAEGAFFGIVSASLAVAAEMKLRTLKLRAIAGAAFGIFTSLILANLLTYALTGLSLTPSTGNRILILMVNLTAAFIGASVGLRIVEEVDLTVISKIIRGKSDFGLLPKVLDTSVLIDGRIADVAETGFMDGTIVVPAFILAELHQIADSPDDLKKTRGRRGIEVVHRLQQNAQFDVRIVNEDFPRIKEVDHKLIELCKKIDGKIVTNDFNLNKLAELHGVGAVNINLLATSTRPLLLPGEEISSILVVKEGKEPGQGLAYLEDGTMVVVDNARKRIGQKVNVQVTSVLQTPTGRMIFAKFLSEPGATAAAHRE